MMKKMKGFVYGIGIICAGLCMVTGCGRGGDNAAQSEEVMQIEENSVCKWNPLQVEGYRYFEGGEQLNEMGDLKLMAEIPANSKIGGKYISSISLLSGGEGTVVADYVLFSDTPMTEGSFDGEMSLGEYSEKVVAFDKENIELLEEVSLETENQGITDLGKAYCVTTYGEESLSYQILNEDLTEKYAAKEVPSDTIQFTTDGGKAYFVENKRICRYLFEEGVTEEIESDIAFYADYIVGVLTETDGKEYVIFRGMAADYENYEFVMDGETGEILCAYAMDTEYTSILYDVYQVSFSGAEEQSKWLVSASREKAYEYQWEKEDIYLSSEIMSNGRDLIFLSVDADCMYIGLYKKETGEEVASTCLEFKDQEGVMNFYGAPFYLDEDTLLLHFIGQDNANYFVAWDLQGRDEMFRHMKVSEHEMGSFAMVDLENCGYELPTPEDVSEDLLPLKEKADAMEEKYDVDICIGQECGDFFGDYVVHTLTDYDMVEEALNVLDQEMGRYPEGFFAQIPSEGEEALRFYLVGDLIGISELGLDKAGGFQSFHEDRKIIVLDVQNTWFLQSSFHHELCHAIEDKMLEWEEGEEESVYEEPDWIALNPRDLYEYSYTEEVSEEDDAYLYDSNCYDGGDMSQVCFIDYYSMAFPTEDMARIFEAVMSDAQFDVDFDRAPILKRKLNYLCECIRESFDTTGWGEVPWEEYME